MEPSTQGTTARGTAARSAAQLFSTRYLLSCVAIGVAGAALLIPANWVSTVLFATVPFVSIAIAGLWLLPSVIALRLLQRPGAGLLVGLVSGLVLVPFSGYGVTSVLTNLWWALFAEIGFLVVLYRFWTLWQHYAGALVIGIVYPITAWQWFNLGTMPPAPQAGFFTLTLASCLAGTALGILVAKGLRQAGLGLRPVSGKGRARPTRDRRSWSA